MMDAYDALIERRSVRKYKSDRVPEDILEKIALAGTYAPSGMNRQPGKIIIVRDEILRDRLERLNAKAMGNEDARPFYGAKDLIVVLADKSAPTYLYDGSLIMGNILNAAYSLGVSSCWIHRAKEVFESEEGRKILLDLGIDGEYEGIGQCILGYSDGPEPDAKDRKEGVIVYA